MAGNENEPSSSTAPRKLSKQELMALALGRDPKAEAENFQKVAEQRKVETEKWMGRRRATAVAAVITGIAMHIFWTTSPTSPLVILTSLEKMSPPLQTALSNGKPTMIEFWADYCKDCQYMAPGMSRLHAEYSNDVNFVLLDGNKPENQEAVSKFRVDGIPHITFVEPDGKTIDTTLIGLIPKDVVRANLEALKAHQEMPYKGVDLFGDSAYDDYYD